MARGVCSELGHAARAQLLLHRARAGVEDGGGVDEGARRVERRNGEPTRCAHAGHWRRACRRRGAGGVAGGGGDGQRAGECRVRKVAAAYVQQRATEKLVKEGDQGYWRKNTALAASLYAKEW